MKIATSSNPILTVFVSDDNGKPVTGLVAATFPSLSYIVNGPNASVAFPSLNDLASLTTAYNAGGIKERSGGYYRVDGPTGITATEGTTVTVIGEATNQHVICPPLDIGAVTLLANQQFLDANSTKLANLDATVSSRLSASSYTAPTTPPTTAQIQAYLDANSTKLANLDAAVSSRLAASSYTAPTTPPTVAQIRAEMDTNSTQLAAILAKFTGITFLAKWLGLIAGKTADSSTLAEINATPAGATYNNTTKSLEAASGGSGGPITLDGITSNGTTAIRNALAGQNLGVYSSTIKLPRGWSMTIVQGDDCLNANNHALGGWICPDPSLVGTTAYLAIHLPGQTDVVSAGVSVTSSTQTLWFELPRTVTANMLPDEGTFDNRFVDSSGLVSTWVVDGVVRVKARIG